MLFTTYDDQTFIRYQTFNIDYGKNEKEIVLMIDERFRFLFNRKRIFVNK